MNVEVIFLGCFLLGLVFSIGSFFGSHLHFGHFHLGSHGMHSHGGGAGQWVNTFSLASFLCWFGGVGYLLQRTHSFTLIVVLLLALAAGCTGGAVISLFLTRVLMRSERALQPEDTEMRGVLARVSNRVLVGGTGEIIFTLDGTRRCSAARSQETQTLARGTEVVVTSYSRGVAWVVPFHTEADAAPVRQGATY